MSKYEMSPRIKKAAEEYLLKYDIDFECLSGKQKECFLKYIKRLRLYKFNLIFFVLSVLFLVFISITYYGMVTYYINDHYSAAFLVNQNSYKDEIIMTIPQYKELLREYGMLCANLSSSVFAAVILSVSLLAFLLISSDKRKIFDAFLPSVKRNPSVNSENHL